MSGRMDAYAHCADLVRDADKDRFLATLFAPEPARHGLLALYAFNVEVSRVRDRVSEPLPGEIRLQWWRDAVSAGAEGTGAAEDAAAHPVAAALLDTISRYRLPRQAFRDLLDARVFDLYDDVMPSLNDLEGYAGETSSALIQLGCIVLADGTDPGTAEAAGHAGVAYALTGLLRALPFHASRGQVYVPKDLLERHGGDAADIIRGRATPGVRAALTELRAVTRRHLASARALLPSVPRNVLPAFLPVALVEPYLDRMDRIHDPFRTPVEVPQWRRQLRLWRQARRGTI